MKIFDYKYKAKRLKDGKIVYGMTEAPSRALADKFLMETGLKSIDIYKKTSYLAILNRITLDKIIKERDLIFYLKQLASLLKAGIKLNEASEILATQQTDKNVRRILYGIYYEVNSGQTLSDSYREYPREFPKLLIAMVEVGEKTGELYPIINDMVNYLEKQYRLKSSIRSTLMLPIIYMVVASAVAVFILIGVLPQFKSMYDSLGGELPGITTFFMDVGDFLILHWWKLVLGLISAILGYKTLHTKSIGFERFMASLFIRLPIFGDLIKLNNLSRISSTLSQMLNKHVPLQDALATTFDTVDNRVYKDLIVQAQKNVTSGEYMSDAFENHYAVEVVFSRMVNVGEKTGDLDRMLHSLSSFYDEDSDVKIERLKKALEPLLLLFVYALVVMMILAVMLPSLYMSSQIGN